MPHSIVEFYPATREDGLVTVVRRVSQELRDFPSIILAWVFCLLGGAQVALAIAAMAVVRTYLQPQQTCLLEDEPATQTHACQFTYGAGGLTIPVSLAVMAIEALPSHVVTSAIRNTIPLVLLLVGTIVWGVLTATLQGTTSDTLQQPERHWHNVTVGSSWANMTLFLSALLIKMMSSAISSCIDRTSICCGHFCPDDCVPACDVCCCLDVKEAKVPREVMRQGRVTVRYLKWNRELLNGAPHVAAEMTRL